MKRAMGIRAAVALATIALGAYAVRAQQGSAEKVGEKVGRTLDRAVGDVKRGAQKVGEGVREGFDKARDKVDGMGIESRVYGRLHWDKALTRATLTLEMREPGVVVLKGSVPDEAARAKALSLARDTVGVTGVVDELGVPRSGDSVGSPRKP